MSNPERKTPSRLKRHLLPKKFRKYWRRNSSRSYLYRGQVMWPANFEELHERLRLRGRIPWKVRRHLNYMRPVKTRVLGRKNNANLVSAVVAADYGNFGNQILEAACAVAVARNLDVSRVILRRRGVFKPGFFQINGTELEVPLEQLHRPRPTDLLRHAPQGAEDETHLFGAFMLNWLMAPYPQSNLSTIYKNLADAIDIDLRGEPLPENDLTVSFRGGDAFAPEPPPHYGQPPLGFYQKVARRFSSGAIRVVSDDARNPAMEGFLFWCRDRGFECEYVTQDWKEDVRLLYRSRNVVASRGSFVPAVCSMSPNVTNLWHFERCDWPIPAVGVRVVVDKVGRFREAILDNNWEASADQIDMLLDYPESALKILP